VQVYGNQSSTNCEGRHKIWVQVQSANERTKEQTGKTPRTGDPL
jgi:hypothetical protein